MIRLIIGPSRDNPETPKHALFSPLIDPPTIFVPTDDPNVPPHIGLSHELAHVKLGHGKPGMMGDVGGEYQAIELEIRQLMSGGEWNAEAKESVIYGFSSYVGREPAERLVDSLERRIKRELKEV